MRRALAALLLVLSALGTAAAVSGPASATAVRSLSVTGTGAAMYPAFDPAIDRYALTTTDLTLGTVDVAATPGPGETVTIDGGSATHLTGLTPGHLITVVFTGGLSPHTYTVMYLPPGFPTLTVTTGAHGSFDDVQPGLVGLTLNTFSGGAEPAFDAIVDRNGVPAYVNDPSSQADLDLKQQPTGEITAQRPTAASAPNTGVSAFVLDPATELAPSAHYEMKTPFTNTDGHDSVRLPDGSTILLGYEPNLVTLKTDATIEKLDSAGHVVFTWSSGDDPAIAAESTADATTQGSSGDYAHINSVVSLANGDLLVSFRHLSAVYRISTDPADNHPDHIVWKLGGRDSDFDFVGGFPGGPCAQHAVSELPNGHLLVFDNGSGGASHSMCLDDGPAAATTTRLETHVEEYALDTSVTPHTATMVWSYPSDGSKYSFFAGSARRMANGNTLIGWAADRNTLATEVDATKDVLWELATPVAAHRYMTYRAELITALRPTITPTGPADGTTVVAGDTVPAGASCSDWHGHALDNCTVTGLVSGNLDTSTPGARTWQVLAQDGAGNTTTLTRHYTVRPAGRQPDGLVRKAGSTTWKGDNLYGSSADQGVRQQARRGQTVTSSWRVQNDGERADTFRLAGTAGSARMRVHYFSGGTDVTRAVVAGTYLTASLTPGQSVTLRVEVTPTRRSRSTTTRTFTLRSASVADATRSDQVAVQVARR